MWVWHLFADISLLHLWSQLIDRVLILVLVIDASGLLKLPDAMFRLKHFDMFKPSMALEFPSNQC